MNQQVIKQNQNSTQTVQASASNQTTTEKENRQLGLTVSLGAACNAIESIIGSAEETIKAKSVVRDGLSSYTLGNVERMFQEQTDLLLFEVQNSKGSGSQKEKSKVNSFTFSEKEMEEVSRKSLIRENNDKVTPEESPRFVRTAANTANGSRKKHSHSQSHSRNFSRNNFQGNNFEGPENEMEVLRTQTAQTGRSKAKHTQGFSKLSARQPIICQYHTRASSSEWGRNTSEIDGGSSSLRKRYHKITEYRNQPQNQNGEIEFPEDSEMEEKRRIDLLLRREEEVQRKEVERKRNLAIRYRRQSLERQLLGNEGKGRGKELTVPSLNGNNNQNSLLQTKIMEIVTFECENDSVLANNKLRKNSHNGSPNTPLKGSNPMNSENLNHLKKNQKSSGFHPNSPVRPNMTANPNATGSSAGDNNSYSKAQNNKNRRILDKIITLQYNAGEDLEQSLRNKYVYEDLKNALPQRKVKQQKHAEKNVDGNAPSPMSRSLHSNHPTSSPKKIANVKTTRKMSFNLPMEAMLLKLDQEKRQKANYSNNEMRQTSLVKDLELTDGVSILATKTIAVPIKTMSNTSEIEFYKSVIQESASKPSKSGNNLTRERFYKTLENFGGESSRKVRGRGESNQRGEDRRHDGKGILGFRSYFGSK